MANHPVPPCDVDVYADTSDQRDQVIEDIDHLTGLKNRRALFLELDRRLKLPERVAILFINIDNFKAVNDTFGVLAGDNVLREIAHSFSTRADSYRSGGNAFAVIAPSPSRNEALQLAESIRAEIGGLAFEGHPNLQVTARVGGAVAPDDANTSEELYRCADDALYKATRDGGNCVKMYDVQLRIESLDSQLASSRKMIELLEQKMVADTAHQSDQLRATITNLERVYDITLEAFGDALALRDAATEAHCGRVAGFAIAIARAMALPKEEVSVIGRAAFLHDFGKLAIPDAILRKPGPLSPEETAVMRQYVRWGYETIKRISFLADAAEIVHCHQERCDGTGYPRGLKGTQIPLGAKIVAVANAFDAITSDHPYRSAQSSQIARREIEGWSGRQFDPLIVGTFLAIPDTVWDDLRTNLLTARHSIRDKSPTLS